MKYQVIELEKPDGSTRYRVRVRFLLFFWYDLRGPCRFTDKGDSYPGELLWFDSIEEAERAVLNDQVGYKSRVAKEVTFRMEK